MALIGTMKYLTIGNNTYEIDGGDLPIASASTLGGIKVGSGLTIDSTTGVLNATGTSITIDNEMSDSSTNPVQNKVIKEYVDDSVGGIVIPTKVSDLTNDSGFITTPNVIYCTCDTAAATAAKVATVVSGSLASLNAGDQAIVKFTNANGVASPTLQIGSLAAKSIKRYGTTAPSTSATTSWQAGSCILFVYDGTYWQMCDWTNTNTTYSALSEADMQAGTATTARLITAARLKEAVEYHAPVTSVNGATGEVTISVPTKTSDLTNDSGFITGYTETDPIFTASAAAGITSTDISNWNGKTSNTGTVTSIGLSNATNGGLSISGSPITSSGSITVGHSNVLASAQTTSGIYPIKIDKNGHISEYGSAVSIPTKTSDLTNDSGFITSYTDYKVKQTNITTGTGYPVLLGYQVGNVETTNQVYKSFSNFTFSPETGNLSATKFNEYVLAAACAKRVDTSISASSSSTNLPTSEAVASFVEGKGYITSYTDEKLRTEVQTAYEAYYPILGDSSTTASTKFYSPYHRFHYDSSWAYLQVGDNNRTGNLRLARGNYSNSLFTESLTADRQIKFPNKDGTIALTSDIPTVTDEKLKTYSNYGTSGDVYYLVFGNNTNNAETKYHSTGLAYLEYLVDTDHFARLELGKEGLNGKLSIHDGSNNAYRAVTIESTTLTQQRSLTLPDKSGTVALTSDIPSVPSWALQSTKPTYTASEVGAMSTSHPANDITSANITTWNSIISDDHKWNDVSLTHGLNASGNDFYVPGIGTVDGTAANLNRVTNTPMNYAIARYGTGAYLYSTTPSANDNSTKVATTAYVDAAIPVVPTEIFVAVHGTTTSAEIEAAYQAGKEVICQYNSRIYRLVYRSSATLHTFEATYFDILSGNQIYVVFCNNDAWSTALAGKSVPTSRTINSKALSSNITLSASDVSALPDTTPYITEEGTSDNWTYRKWSSGKIEAWVHNYTFASASWSTWSSPVRYMDKTFTIPSGIFTTAPNTIATSTSNQYWVVDSNASSATAGNMRIASCSSSAMATYVNIYAWAD